MGDGGVGLASSVGDLQDFSRIKRNKIINDNQTSQSDPAGERLSFRSAVLLCPDGGPEVRRFPSGLAPKFSPREGFAVPAGGCPVGAALPVPVAVPMSGVAGVSQTPGASACGSPGASVLRLRGPEMANWGDGREAAASVSAVLGWTLSPRRVGVCVCVAQTPLLGAPPPLTLCSVPEGEAPRCTTRQGDGKAKRLHPPLTARRQRGRGTGV